MYWKHFEFKNKFEFINRFIKECAPFFYMVYDKVFYDEIVNFCTKFDFGANYNRRSEKLLIFIDECEFTFIYPKVFKEYYYRAKTQFKCYIWSVIKILYSQIGRCREVCMLEE